MEAMTAAADLALEWGEDVSLRRGPEPSDRPILFIVNHGSSIWRDDAGECCAFVQAFDAQSGGKMPSGPVAIGGVGRTYRLAPGERVAIGAVFSGIRALAARGAVLLLRVPRLSIRGHAGLVRMQATL